jgi:hypothetical protein
MTTLRLSDPCPNCDGELHFKYTTKKFHVKSEHYTCDKCGFTEVHCYDTTEADKFKREADETLQAIYTICNQYKPFKK